MKIKKLLHNNVLVIKQKERKTKGGIILTESYESGKEPRGTVTHIGTKVTQVKVGDKIILPKFKSQDIVIGSEEYTIIKEEQIHAIVED